MTRRTILLFLLSLLLIIPPKPAAAQTPTPGSGPIYIVQEGDTLWSIALRFNITVDELIAANPDINPNLLSVGQELVIPGLEGIQGILRTETIALGDTFRGLMRRTQADVDILQRLNHLVSPTELYVGASFIIPERENATPLTPRGVLAPGESLLELAVRAESDPWALTRFNDLEGTWAAIPGDVLYAPASENEGENTVGTLPPVFASAEVGPLPLKQGGTAEIRVRLAQPATLSGLLVDKPLHFFPLQGDTYVALQGVHAMLEPGPYPMRLEATLEDGSTQAFEQMVLVVSGNYPKDPPLIVDPETIDPSVTEPEEELIRSLVEAATPTRWWEDIFASPASLYPEQNCFTSRYGNRRSYNGGPYDRFHTGLDFCGGEGLPITAPAPGIVVFAGPLTVRGNATIIDHGWGVYSGFWHQSEIRVQVGEQVETGQVIGLVGGTGRVTGAHLHWEIWVNGVQVDPMDWLEEKFPHD
ncbi:MAG: LysM peptidoglycan-binding domain-containing protein [Anaerolineae bacterium]|nr:MAG: LysM peptidoglycan-binding domain-containing protein [Anaerolineae bacterium]